MSPESHISYDIDRARAFIFGPGGFVDLPMSLESARRLAVVLDVLVEIRGQSSTQ